MPETPRQWYEVIRAEASGTAVIRIFGDIGESWWGDSVSAAQFATDLDALGSVSTLEIRLNSPGGDMFDGVAIYNTLRTHQARKIMYVDGLAASAASVIAMAADELVMGTGTQLMIHNAWAFVVGDAEDMRKQASVMDGLNESMATIYADRAGGDSATWRSAMAEETWYGAQEAVDAGLADRVSRREGEAAPDDSAVAATLRRSAVAARFRFQGRAHAPAPKTPSRAAGQVTEGGSVEITDEDFAALRTKLGLPEDAAIGDVLDALDDDESGSDEGTEGAQEQQAETVAARAGVVSLDSAALAALQADAALGRQAREEQVQARRVAAVDAAIKAGKVVPARRDHWLAQIAADEEGVTATLAALHPVFGTAEVGYDDGSVADTSSSPEAVRGSKAYQDWKVI
jgi:ATP-dependent protease ClpP protease subunit